MVFVLSWLYSMYWIATLSIFYIVNWTEELPLLNHQQMMVLYYTVLYYTTLHYTTLHYTTLHYTTLHYTTLHYTTLHYTTLHYTTLHYTTLHYTTLHYPTLHYTTLHYTTQHNTVQFNTILYFYFLLKIQYKTKQYNNLFNVGISCPDSPVLKRFDSVLLEARSRLYKFGVYKRGNIFWKRWSVRHLRKGDINLWMFCGLIFSCHYPCSPVR